MNATLTPELTAADQGLQQTSAKVEQARVVLAEAEADLADAEAEAQRIEAELSVARANEAAIEESLATTEQEQEESRSTVGAIARDVGYVFQDFGNQIVRPTPRDDISFGPLNFGCEDWRERTEAVLDDLDIAHIADAQTWQLSGGQQHLTALAGVLALAPDIIVVDEPAAAHREAVGRLGVGVEEDRVPPALGHVGDRIPVAGLQQPIAMPSSRRSWCCAWTGRQVSSRAAAAAIRMDTVCSTLTRSAKV